MSSEDHVGDKPDLTMVVPDVWPEVERAEHLARGAALKWASGVFCRPEHLRRLSQYRKRESQRTASIHTRLKLMVQSYLEEVCWGMEQLREAQAELWEPCQALKKAGVEYNSNRDEIKSLERLREVSVNHRQLLTAINNLPRLYSVGSMVFETERLLESRRLLEAHAYLMNLEQWQDDILWQLNGAAGMQGSELSTDDQELVSKYFSGVRKLGESLGKELWAVVRNTFAVVHQNPTLFVTTVRIIEREEAIDRVLLEERAECNARPLSPGRPRCWRARFFQVLEEVVTARFRGVSYLHTQGPGLAGRLSTLQDAVMSDLATVRHLLEPCVPPHYRLTRAYLKAIHHCLHAHLTQVSSWDLESGEIFAVLNWVLHVYKSSEMMGHPELLYDMKGEELEPLISPEGLEQLQTKYVSSVRKSVSEWMHKALQVELQDWQRDQEPETNHEGFYQTSLPTIITQMLEENARVALMIGKSLRNQTIQMGLCEMENLLNRKSTESLQQQQSSGETEQFSRAPPNPLAALDRIVRRACRMLMDQLLLDLKPFLTGLLTRPWLIQGEPTPKLCQILEYHLDLYSHVQLPCRQRLQEEAQWLTVVEYVKALMQKRLVCRSAEERRKLTQQMVKDDQQFQEIFHGVAGDGLQSEVEPLTLLPVLADFIKLQDPSMLPLEVSGLATKYPDISEEHVSVLLDIRGDVSRDTRVSILELLQQSTTPLQAAYRPIFTDIQASPSTTAFCLPTAKCT
nr:exocyst complex component 3-like protein isoform X3 [Syngnathus scovelli]